jgi:hypothetical protein
MGGGRAECIPHIGSGESCVNCSQMSGLFPSQKISLCEYHNIAQLHYCVGPKTSCSHSSIHVYRSTAFLHGAQNPVSPIRAYTSSAFTQEHSSIAPDLLEDDIRPLCVEKTARSWVSHVVLRKITLRVSLFERGSQFVRKSGLDV